MRYIKPISIEAAAAAVAQAMDDVSVQRELMQEAVEALNAARREVEMRGLRVSQMVEARADAIEQRKHADHLAAMKCAALVPDRPGSIREHGCTNKATKGWFCGIHHRSAVAQGIV